MLLDPGIFSLDDRPTPADPPTRPSFSGIVADGLDGTQALHDSAGESAAAIVGATGATFEQQHALLLGDTADGLQGETDSLASSPTAADLAGPGARVDVRAEQVSPYLPQPELDPQINLIDPPDLPGMNSPNPYGGGGGPQVTDAIPTN